MSEASRLTKLTSQVLRRRKDVGPVYDSGIDDGVPIAFFGRKAISDDESIYDSVSDSEASWLLFDWLDGTEQLTWEIQFELSKLLANRGYLVASRVEPIVRKLVDPGKGGGDWRVWSPNNLYVSFLCHMGDAEWLVDRLLEAAPMGCRDGLLLACYRMPSLKVYHSVSSAVRKWFAEDLVDSDAGELRMIENLVNRWDTLFPRNGHEDIRRAIDDMHSFLSGADNERRG